MLIYRWWPHGSKNLKNLGPLWDHKKHGDQFGSINPIMVCHDQEPLCHDLYNPSVVHDTLRWQSQASPNLDRLESYMREASLWGLRACVEPFNIYDRILLLHSEQNSTELAKFQQQDIVPVYYWSHALIARDWFRYAQHDLALHRSGSYKQDFLIYNRAWSGSREYRLLFAQYLIENQLVDQCRVSFSAQCNDKHYTQHQYRNQNLAITRSDLEQHFQENLTLPVASADYDNQDYSQCAIEVVMETVMDDQRWHLTEKSLRPMACGAPFLLMSTPGSLEYLRCYGFETFHPMINETYDSIIDSHKRIQCLQHEMARLAALSRQQKLELWRELDQVAQRNRARFFSDEFQNLIVREYKHNLDQALQIMEQYRRGQHLDQVRKLFDQSLVNAPQRSYHSQHLQQLIMAWNRGDPDLPKNW